MNSNSDSNEQVETVVKEEKPISSKSGMEFHHKKFNSIPEANFANNPNSNEFPEGGQETSEKHNVTGQQYIKQERYDEENQSMSSTHDQKAILDNPNAILDNPNAILDNPNAILDNSRFYRSWNPWAVSSIFEFNYFCCPESNVRSRRHCKSNVG